MDSAKQVIVCILFIFNFSSSSSSGLTEIFLKCKAKCGFQKCNSLCSSLQRLDKNSNCTIYCNKNFRDLSICPGLCKLGVKLVVKGNKHGSCPTDLDGFALARINQCKNDMECPSTLKCCSNKQWRTCQPAIFKIESNLPPIPNCITVRVETSAVVHIFWKSKRRKSTIFHVESRYSTKIVRPSHDDMTPWEPAGQTPRRSLKIKSLIPGAWYQFRVSGWSENGTNGFNSSEIIKLPGLIRRPSQPRNVSANGAWFRDGKVDVQISWQSPLILDAPVRRYRILWYKHVLGSVQHYLPVQVHRKRVRGNKVSALLKGLELNSVYMVQIQALIRGAGQPRIKGRWKSVLMKTPLVSHNEEKVEESNQRNKSTPSPQVTKKNTMSKTYERPKFKSTKEEEVKAMNVTLSRLAVSGDGYPVAFLKCDTSDTVNALRISWTPVNCSIPFRQEARSKLVDTVRKEVTLLELRPDCVYSVRVIPFLPGGRRGRMETISFSTNIEKIVRQNGLKKSVGKPNIRLKPDGNSASGRANKLHSLILLTLLFPIWWNSL